LKLLKTYKKTKNKYLLELSKKIILNLTELQGKQVNIESGEEPGKCIHEFRVDNHEHLTKHLSEPWFVYGDNTMRNFDTVDATPLYLIAVHEYFKQSDDQETLNNILENVELALNWIIKYGDSNNDGFIDYYFSPERKFGGLRSQSWMDSTESLFHEDGEPFSYPIAPVEVQAYCFAALKSWGNYFKQRDEDKHKRYTEQADYLKQIFNDRFVFDTPDNFTIAFALDGKGKQFLSPRSSIGHILWSVFEDDTGNIECILYKNYIQKLVERIMKSDLFEENAGVRTLSKLSKEYNPMSYHNGSIWPHDTSIIISGLENFGFTSEANKVKKALLNAYEHFQTPLELFVYNDGFMEYKSENGQTACRKQAWSAASLLLNVG
jgi:glycogen debranching enzyme